VIPVEHLRVEHLDVGVSLPPSALLAFDLPGDDDVRLAQVDRPATAAGTGGFVHPLDGSGQPASLVLSPEYDSRGDSTVRRGRPHDVVVERLAAFVTP
jgi:hypothetical protein